MGDIFLNVCVLNNGRGWMFLRYGCHKTSKGDSYKNMLLFTRMLSYFEFNQSLVVIHLVMCLYLFLFSGSLYFIHLWVIFLGHLSYSYCIAYMLGASVLFNLVSTVSFCYALFINASGLVPTKSIVAPLFKIIISTVILFKSFIICAEIKKSKYVSDASGIA